MSTTAPMTAEQLLKMPPDGMRYELMAGELRMMSPSGWKHGEVVGNLHGLLWRHVHVTSYRSATDVTTQTFAAQLDGGQVVRGLCCPVAEIFGATESP